MAGQPRRIRLLERSHRSHRRLIARDDAILLTSDDKNSPVYVDSTLGSSDARVKRHSAAEPIDTMLAAHASGRSDHGQSLWMLLTLEVFLRREGW